MAQQGSPIQANPLALVESIAQRLHPQAQEDFRNFSKLLLDNLTALSPGGNLVQIGGAQAGGSKPPVGVTHVVQGANAQYTVAINNPPGETRPIWHRVSYGPLVSFSKDVTAMEPTTQTSVVIPTPGTNGFVQLESSYDKKTWSKPQLSSTKPIDAGLVSSSATAPGGVFNQTNYAVVSSKASGAGAAIEVNGTGGNFTPYTAVRGATQVSRPSATIVGNLAGQQFVGYDGAHYQLKSTLAQTMDDKLEPVGAVVIGSGQTGGGQTAGGNGGRLTNVAS